MDGQKQSLWFRRRDGKPIVMPGLSGIRNLKGEERLCCAIITTKPNEFFGQSHERQVCVLSPEEMDTWMTATEPRTLPRGPAASHA